MASGEAGESTEGIEGAENDGDGEEGHSGMRSHRKMFECDVCNMKFSNGANMRRHKVSLKRLHNIKICNCCIDCAIHVICDKLIDMTVGRILTVTNI